MRRLPAAGSLLVIAILAALAGVRAEPAAPAYAHALLVRADPPVNAQLREPPSVLTLYFSEALERRISTARVLDANQKRVDTGVEFDDQDDALMRVSLGEVLPGYLTVVWETLSKVDGHRISGSYPLTILNPDGSAPAGAAPGIVGGSVAGTRVKPSRVLVKWALLVAGSVLLGSLAFTWVAAALPGRAGRDAGAAADYRAVNLAFASVAVLAAFGVVDLALQANDLGGLGKVVEVLGFTRWGGRWFLRQGLVLPLATGLAVLSRRPSPLGSERALLGGLAALTVAYLALTVNVSHAAAGAGSFWAQAADLIHLGAASLWAGLLLNLALALRWGARELRRNERPLVVAVVLQRFSLLAVVSVALLLFTGTLNAVFEVSALRDLADSAYGRVLVLKLLLVLPLLVAGGFNAYVYRPRVEREAAGMSGRSQASRTPGWSQLERRLTTTVRIEGVAVLAVLAAAAVLGQTSPTRAALSAPAEVEGKFVATKEAGDVGVTLVIDPNQPGANTFETYLTGAVATVERVRLRLVPLKGPAAEADLVLEAANPPTFYVGSGPYLVLAGDWRITVDLRRSEGSDASVAFAVRVSGASGPAGRSAGTFDAPRPLSAGATALMAAAAAAAFALALASWPRPGRPAGYAGTLADRAAGLRLRPGLSLLMLIAVGMGIGILVGQHVHTVQSPEQASKGNPVRATPGSIARGRALFLANCAQCHGDGGRGDGPLARSLAIPPANLYDHVPYHPDQFFFGVITNGLSGIMPAFGSQLSAEDRWNILNYLRSEFGQPPPRE